MRTIETTSTVPLASVKPLDRLAAYRAQCLEAMRRALRAAKQPRRRERSPITGSRLEPEGRVEELEYGRCPDTGSLFLMELPERAGWAALLSQVNGIRHAPEAFHARLSQSREDHVYRPKVEWIEETLRLQGMRQPRVLEVTTPPSELTRLLEKSEGLASVAVLDEMALCAGQAPEGRGRAQAAVLLESLDRVDDPAGLVRGVVERLEPGGLVFVTALVASGFDVAVLGLKNLYVYPPDRANCFSLAGLSRLLESAGLTLIEVSTPGVLDLEIVRSHADQDPSIALSRFERQILDADEPTHAAFRVFLQQRGLSSFARLVARKQGG